MPPLEISKALEMGFKYVMFDLAKHLVKMPFILRT
jgi:hypothetical protein